MTAFQTFLVCNDRESIEKQTDEWGHYNALKSGSRDNNGGDGFSKEAECVFPQGGERSPDEHGDLASEHAALVKVGALDTQRV